MQKQLLISLILLLGISSLSALDVQGTIDGDTWYSDSTIVVIGDILVEELTIEPGVTVLFEGDYSFEISGILEAQGFHSDSIFFRPSASNSSGWQGLSFLPNAGESVLSYCKIEGANNQGIFMDGCDPFSISNCVVTNNSADGIRVRNTSLDFIQTIVCNNNGKGIFLENAQLSVNNSIISDNDEGIFSLNAADLVNLNNSIIADNRSKSILCLAGSVNISNSVLFDNYLEISSSDTDRIKATYSAVRGGEVYPGTGNINQDPDFVDRISYQLNTNSPCINAGNPDVAYQDKFFPPSLGNTRNDMGAYGGPLAGNWLAPLYIELSYVDFGKVTKDSSRSVKLWVKNYRDHSITVSDISFSENSVYFETDIQDFTIPLGDSTLLQLSFTPDQQYVFLTTMQLQTTADGAVYVDARGEGVVPKINVSRDPLEFDDVIVGNFQTLDLGILNLGADTLRISQLLTTNPAFIPNVVQMKIDPDLAMDTVRITFTPDSNRFYQDSLIILSNDPDEQRLAIPLSGTGLLGPILSLEQQELQFGEVRVLDDSLKQIRFNNTGDLSLNISAIQLDVPDTTTGAFELPNKPDVFPFILKPDSAFTLQALFSPLQRGFDATNIVFNSDDPGNETVIVTLAGTGISPVIETSTTFFNYDSVDVGSDSSWTLEITNQGDAILELEQVLLMQEENGPFDFDGSRPNLPYKIMPAERLELPIHYIPGASGTDTALVKIISDDPVNGIVEVALQGFGVAPRIETLPLQLNFGAIPFDADSSILFTIFNRGDRNLVIYADKVRLSGTDSSLFQLDKNLHKDKLLPPGDSISYSIVFDPQNLGVKAATLNIGSNDPGNPQIQINLSGTATDNQQALVSFIPPGSGFQYHTQVTMGFNITTNAATDSAHLFLRLGGQTHFAERALQKQTEGRWSTELDTALLSERGIEYYLRCWHGFRVTDWPENGYQTPATASVSIPELEFPWLTKEKKYQLISLPLTSSGQSLSQLFGNNLGHYDNAVFRIFDCSDGIDYNELKDMNTPLPPGKSLFLITKDALHLDVANTRSVPTDQDYLLQLKAGWNMIASPFAFPVDWSGPPLNYYNENDWEYANQLEPFKGYLVKAPTDTVIFIPPVEVAAEKAIVKTIAFIPGEEWHIRIEAQAGAFYDRLNFAGVHADALDEPDKLDYAEPPPIGTFVSVRFLNDATDQIFASDYRQPGQEGYFFKFEVWSNTSVEKQISFDSSTLPEDFEWAVFSDETGLKYETQPIRIQASKQQFQLVAGTKSFVAQVAAEYSAAPNTFKIRQNYPNPFNPTTRIDYQIPQRTEITLEIYDMLGRRIKTLIPNQIKETGYHHQLWDGTNNAGNSVSTGIYFLRLRSKKFNKTIKMILQK